MSASSIEIATSTGTPAESNSGVGGSLGLGGLGAGSPFAFFSFFEGCCFFSSFCKTHVIRWHSFSTRSESARIQRFSKSKS